MAESISPRIGFGECYYDHFVRFLGAPMGRERFDWGEGLPVMQIAMFDNVFGACRAFCSFGLSRYDKALGSVAEVFMPVDAAWQETPTVLANVLYYMVQERKTIGPGLSIRFVQAAPEIAHNLQKAALYFSTPFGVPLGFETVHCGKEIGRIYLACYITEAEYTYFKQYGAERFETLLEEKQVDVFDIGRPSAL